MELNLDANISDSKLKNDNFFFKRKYYIYQVENSNKIE